MIKIKNILGCIFVLLCVNNVFSQDSTQVYSSSFEKSYHDFSQKDLLDSLKTHQLIYSEKMLILDSIEYDSILSSHIVESLQLDFLKMLKPNEIHVVHQDTVTNYFKCLKIDSVFYFRYAQITLPLGFNNLDSIYTTVQKDIEAGIKWDACRINRNSCRSMQKEDFTGLTSWIREGKLDPDFENQLVKIKKGDLALIKLEKYQLAWIVYMTDSPVNLAERIVNVTIVPNTK